MSHDKKIAVGTSKGTIVLINVNDYLNGIETDKKWRSSKKEHEFSINAMRLNRRGDWLLTGDKSGVVKFFRSLIISENTEIKKGSEEDALKHNDAVRDIAFSPTYEKFITCSDDKTLRIADLAAGKVERVLEGHGSDISTVDWHPSHSMIASGGKDRYIKVWDPRAKEEICSLYNHTNSIAKARFSNNGDYLLTGGKD